MRTVTVAVLLLVLPALSLADVTSSAANGFTVEHELVVDAPRMAVYEAAINSVGQWWSSDHTMSGDASRMSIDERVMGCFCEDLDSGNGVVHLVVTFVNRGIVIRLTGGLGPLGLMGVAGNMTWEFFDAPDGGTRLKWTYAVGGHREGGLDALALPVDYVIGDALSRLGSFVETGNADNAKPAAPGD